ncbi:hypothetical protein PFTANZ_00106 [Plasmodium falciparum Tanzania (2000708)]|uniref:Uncharacterized protein n=1 Tax=Plasmodium falciparum Tanzania (2000708) TaxID=1036725 RepID=A0A024WEV9_PLAFA|nr:hypothetical protein PFTANZ_00106 [Plasmodium falciparum Tanzania (2000708)]
MYIFSNEINYICKCFYKFIFNSKKKKKKKKNNITMYNIIYM